MRLKTAVVFALAIVWLAPVVAREIITPLAILYTGACLLVLGVVALLVWHHAKTLAYRDRLAPLDGWKKLGASRWACPHCAAEVTGWQGRKHHSTAPTSPCAAFQQHLGTVTDEVREMPGAGWPAVIDDEKMEA